MLQVSRTWTELTGYALSDVPTGDAWLSRAYGADADAVRVHVHELFKGDRKSLNVEFVIHTRGGADRNWSFSASAPGTLRDGRRFMVGMAVDMTERVCAQEAMRESEERLRLALHAARMGTWTWDVAGNRHTRDGNLNRLLGLEGWHLTHRILREPNAGAAQTSGERWKPRGRQRRWAASSIWRRLPSISASRFCASAAAWSLRA